MPPTLTILIVSYNTREMTLAALDSLLAGARATSHEVIVVDNASSDGSAVAIAEHPTKPRLIALSENVGFARANNLAAGLAEGELLLLLNPDTVVLDGAIDALVAFARRRPEAQIWGGRTLFGDGRLNPSSAWGRMTLWRLICRATGLTGVLAGTDRFNGEAMGGFPRDSEREVDIISGCFLLTSLALWRRLGGFDPTFFMYGEDADLCLRGRHLGARPAVTPDATIVHHGGASEATREGKMVKLLAAKATLIDRHFPRVTRQMGLWLNAAWPLGRWLALAAVGHATGRRSLTDKARIWHAVWVRRAEWDRGWGASVASAAPEPTVATLATPIGAGQR